MKQNAAVKEKTGVRGIFRRSGNLVRRGVRGYNHRLSRVYSPNVAAITGVVAVAVIAAILLFIPPFTGVADDGSLSGILTGTGLGYRPDDMARPVGAYFVRLYLHSTYQPEGISAHRALIRAAMWIDDLCTHDNLFDIRFLALIYLILYLPAVYLVLRGIAARVRVAAEATFLVILGAIILGDGAVLRYFNSLYPDAFCQVFLAYCLGFCLMLQHEKAGRTITGLLGLAAAGSILALTESHCAAAGIVLAVFCARQIMMEERTQQISVTAGVCTAVLLLSSVLSSTAGSTRFTEASKLHAVTNGILMRADNPGETLQELRIDPRFETLTDISSYEAYPYATSGAAEIQRDFLSKYTAGSVFFYYMKHPLVYAGMLELGTQAAFSPARSYVGNYEYSPDAPERRQSQLMVYYSNFKAESLPRTIGFLAILLIVYLVLFRRQRGLQHFVLRWTARERQIMLGTFLCLLGIGIADITGVICQSGTAELERYQTLYSSCIDGMLLMFMAEILHRLNILSTGD